MDKRYEKFLDVISLPNDIKVREKKFLEACAFNNPIHFEKLASSHHFRYLKGYLLSDSNGLKAKTIVIEKAYISTHYLGDYFNYYAHCHREYPKLCKRLHFFEDSINYDAFIEMLYHCDFNHLEKKNTEINKKWDGYLGHIVIKPLPTSIIGTTILKPYKKEPGRFYTAIKEYNIHFFGKKLKLETLTYQEQDGIVGSCASSALWFAFQKTAELFHSRTTNTSDITISAGTTSLNSGSIFPSKALDLNQVGRAILSAGLKSEIRLASRFINDKRWIKAFLYSYLRMGVPVLLGLTIEGHGTHLVTINGYRINQASTSTKDKSPYILDDLYSDSITKFYAHDDQAGPFSKLEFSTSKKFILKSSWRKDIGSNEELNAKVFCAVVPLSKEIKVTFDNIYEEVHKMAALLVKFVKLTFVWNIFLSDSNSYKVHIRNKMSSNKSYFDDTSEEVLFEPLPRYIWVVQAYIKEKNKDFLILDVLYDAADINFSDSPCHGNIYNKDLKEKFRSASLDMHFKIFSKKFDNQNVEEQKQDLPEIVSVTTGQTRENIQKVVTETTNEAAKNKQPESKKIEELRTSVEQLKSEEVENIVAKIKKLDNSGSM